MIGKEKNKFLIQSYKLSTVRDNAGIIGQRLLLRLVDMANKQGYVEGVKLSECPSLDFLQKDLFGDFVFTLPVKDVMGVSENYSAVKRSIMSLMRVIVETEREDGYWVACPFITFAVVGKGMITVGLHEMVCQALLDFRKGYRRFEILPALKFRSTYAMRLYILMSDQINPLTYTIIDLKKMFGIEKKYNRPRDFFKYVLDPAKAELDKCSPYTFRYEPVFTKTHKTGRPAITQVVFYPIHQQKFEDPDLQDSDLMGKYTFIGHPCLTKAQQDVLIHKFGFSQNSIRNNYDLIKLAVENLDFTKFLDKVSINVSKTRPKNVVGYVINAIKMELSAKGVEFE